MTLIDQLKTIADPRAKRGQRHPLWLILLLALLGSLCGYWGYRPLARFTHKHHASLCHLLELPLSTPMPSYSTFRRVFQQVDAQVWVNLFNTWSLLDVPDLSGRLLATDGKSIKCTATGGNSAQQNFATLVSVYGHADEGVVQLQLMYNNKTSEIEIAKQLFGQLPRPQHPCCLTLDALHAQTESVKTLCTLGLAYLIGLKKNQPTLYRNAQSQHEQGKASSQASHWEQGHGRQVEHRVWVYVAPVELQQRWQGLTRLIWVERQGWRGKVRYQQSHCYLSNCDWSAQQFLAAIRGHWGIENKLHWVKDVTFHEDEPPRRGGHAPVSWAIFHSFFITIARRLGFRTVPDAQRDLANQVQQVFSLLV